MRSPTNYSDYEGLDRLEVDDFDQAKRLIHGCRGVTKPAGW